MTMEGTTEDVPPYRACSAAKFLSQELSIPAVSKRKAAVGAKTCRSPVYPKVLIPLGTVGGDIEEVVLHPPYDVLVEVL